MYERKRTLRDCWNELHWIYKHRSKHRTLIRRISYITFSSRGYTKCAMMPECKDNENTMIPRFMYRDTPIDSILCYSDINQVYFVLGRMVSESFCSIHLKWQLLTRSFRIVGCIYYCVENRRKKGERLSDSEPRGCCKINVFRFE
jgi:hypothetical protein